MLNYIPQSKLFSQVTLRDRINEELWWSPYLEELSALKELYHSGGLSLSQDGVKSSLLMKILFRGKKCFGLF